MLYTCSAQVGKSDIKEMIVTASFYCHGSKACKIVGKGITATGDRVRKGLIAVDPKIIPLRRHVEIIEPKNIAGMYYSADTGKDIKKQRVDIWVPSQKEAVKLGKIKNVVLRIYPKDYKVDLKKEEDVSKTIE